MKKEDRIFEIIKNQIINHPERFSAMWFNGHSLDDSIVNNNRDIQISKNGRILCPSIEINIVQMEELRKLVAGIFKRDKESFLDESLISFINKYKI